MFEEVRRRHGELEVLLSCACWQCALASLKVEVCLDQSNWQVTSSNSNDYKRDSPSDSVPRERFPSIVAAMIDLVNNKKARTD